MTGFGRGEVTQDGLAIVVEIRSLNHRFLDVDVRAPRSLSACEQEIKNQVAAELSRGRISVSVSMRGEHATATKLVVDRALARNYLDLLEQLKQDFQLNGQIELQQLLTFPDIIAPENSDDVDEELMRLLKSAVAGALSDLKAMRQREGEEIEKDLRYRVDKINQMVIQIEDRAQGTSRMLYEKLRERVAAIVDSEVVDEGRLEMETAILADKADVTEECIRFKSHNTLFLELLAKAEPVGRKLNFLLQEMHREANTIGAKSSDADISHLVVEIKEEVEKLREQVQNIE